MTEITDAPTSKRLLRDFLVKDMEDAAILTLIGQRRIERARAQDDLDYLEREIAVRRKTAT